MYAVTVDVDGTVTPRGASDTAPLHYDDALDLLHEVFIREARVTHGLLMKWDWPGDGTGQFLLECDDEELARLRVIRHWPDEVRTLARSFGLESVKDRSGTLRRFPDHLVSVFLRGQFPAVATTRCRTCGR